MMNNDFQGNNNENSGYFVIPEWKQSKDQVLKDYFELIDIFSSCYNRDKTYNQLSRSEHLTWLKHLRKLFIQVKEYDKDFHKMSLKDFDKEINTDDITKLAEFTEKILTSSIIEEIRSIAKTQNDPIVEYKKEAYIK